MGEGICFLGLWSDGEQGILVNWYGIIRCGFSASILGEEFSRIARIGGTFRKN
jgi:hypothetical protein